MSFKHALGAVTTLVPRRGAATLSACTPPAKVKQRASVEDLKVLAHPVRWRILRSVRRPVTHQQAACRTAEPVPGHHLAARPRLGQGGFSRRRAGCRSGERGALERPYRATGRTWGLVAVDLDQPDLRPARRPGSPRGTRAELLEAGPESGRDTSRGIVRLGPESLAELKDRMEALLVEFIGRDEPEGEPLTYLWSLGDPPLKRRLEIGSAHTH